MVYSDESDHAVEIDIAGLNICHVAETLHLSVITLARLYPLFTNHE